MVKFEKQAGEDGRTYYYAHQARLPGVMGEQFVLVDGPAEARFVDQRLNDEEAMRVKRSRLAAVRDRGEVSECDMPDVKRAAQLVLWLHSDELRQAGSGQSETIQTQTLVGHPQDVLLSIDGLEVNLPRRQAGYIKLDGREVRGVQSMTLQLGVEHQPKVTLEVIPGANS